MYEVECLECVDDTNEDANVENEETRKWVTLYVGTSGHTLHKRIEDHMYAVKKGHTNQSALAKHQRDKHLGKTPNFVARVLGNFPKNLYRFIAESIYIEDKATKCCLLNQRG